jgi:hypothetical protein
LLNARIHLRDIHVAYFRYDAKTPDRALPTKGENEEEKEK